MLTLLTERHESPMYTLKHDSPCEFVCSTHVAVLLKGLHQLDYVSHIIFPRQLS